MDKQLIEKAKDINLAALIEKCLGAPVRKSGHWAQWMCPFHSDGHSPSFSVNLTGNFFKCFGCNVSGDSIKFLMLYEHLPFREAIERLTNHSLTVTAHQRPAHAALTVDYVRWQRTALDVLTQAEAALWGPGGERVLQYLQQSRCLTLATIKEARLGYWPNDSYVDREDFGLPGPAGTVWIPRGIMIPYISQGVLWSVNIRRPVGTPKYFKLTGSRPAIYNYDALRGAVLSVFTEGEFDAMLLYQDFPESTAATLGGAAVSKIDLGAWGSNLMTIPALYLASDCDAAGLGLAAGLGDFSRRFKRLALPGGKDITEYRRAGGDLAAWMIEQVGALA